MIKSKIYLLSAFLIALSSCTSSKKQQEVEITSNVDRIILETDIGNDVNSQSILRKDTLFFIVFISLKL